MLEINLLPPEERDNSKVKFFVIAVAIFSVVFCAWVSYVYSCLVRAEQELEKNQTAYELIMPTINQQSTLQDNKNKITDKLRVLAELSEGNDAGYTFLVALGYLITEDVWLREIVRVEPGVWILKGEMTSYQHLVNFMERFSQDTIFSVPEIQQVSTDNMMPTFELRVKLRE